MAKNTKGGLGRGLNALLGSYEESPAPRSTVNAASSKKVEEKPAPVGRDEEPLKSEEINESYPEDNIHIKGVVQRRAAASPAQAASRPAVSTGSRSSAASSATAVSATGTTAHSGSDQQPKSVAERVEEKINSRATDEVDIDSIAPNPDQPRTNFNKEELEELASSIAKHGLLQPVLVRAVEGKGSVKYEIIAGERRWQASKNAGLKKIPVRVKEADEDAAFELALIENIQRSDLNPIEEAYGYRRLMERRNMTQSDVAQAMSKGRSTVANALRLLDLPERAQQLLFEDKITAGHARAILSIPTKEGREKLTEKLANEKLSVREAESIARLFAGKKAAPSESKRAPMPASFKSVAKSLRKAFDTNVRVKTVKGKNKIEIEFQDEEDLKRIFEKITASGE